MSRSSSTPSDTIRVGIIEDDLLYRDYLLNVLESTGRYTTLACALSAEEAMAWSPQLRLQAVLCDIRLPGQDGPATVAHLTQSFPKLSAIMLTAHADTDSILDSFQAGASGYIIKGATSSEIIEALDDVVAGGAPMSPSIARRVLALLRKPQPIMSAPGAAAETEIHPPTPTPLLEVLTPRENDVILLVVAGHSDKEVADRLGVSRSAVKNHLSNIYSKWRVRSRTEAAVRFIQSRQP